MDDQHATHDARRRRRFSTRLAGSNGYDVRNDAAGEFLMRRLVMTVVLAFASPLAAAAADPEVTLNVPVTLTDVPAFAGPLSGRRVEHVDIACLASQEANAHLTAYPNLEHQARTEFTGVAPVPFRHSEKTVNGRSYEVLNYSGTIAVKLNIHGVRPDDVAALRSYSCAMFLDRANPETINREPRGQTGGPTHPFDDSTMKVIAEGPFR